MAPVGRQLVAPYSNAQRQAVADVQGDMELIGTAKERLTGIMVKEMTGKDVPLISRSTGGSKMRVYAFFTHFGDFNSWEYAEKLRHYLPALDDAGAEVFAVGIGSCESANLFAEETGFPKSKLFADEGAQCHKALGFSEGFQPPVKVNPYFRLLPMLAGIGSPGTLQAVLAGYIGSSSANAEWITSSLNIVDKSRFDVLGKKGARPLEVATLRLQNMVSLLVWTTLWRYAFLTAIIWPVRFKF